MKLAARLLLAIALLLPLRSAMAIAGLLCHASGASAVAAASDDHPHSADVDQHVSQSAHHQHEGDKRSASDSSCSLCTSACSAPPLRSTVELAHLLESDGTEGFPPLRPGPATGSTGAPERPPRTV
jgi:hypothetical protein